MQELVRRGVGSHDIDVAMREAFGPDMQKLHIHHDNAVGDGDQEAIGRYSTATYLCNHMHASCVRVHVSLQAGCQLSGSDVCPELAVSAAA